MSTVAEAGDDEALLAALRQAVDGMRDVPPDFVEAGKKAFAWYNADAELAELTYDSARDSAATAPVPAGTASARALTFSAAHLAIELTVTADSLVGQVTPRQSATITSGTPATRPSFPRTRSAASPSNRSRRSCSACTFRPARRSTC